MGKRNLKKEKAERNKAYARQYRKTKSRFNSKFSRRNFNNPSTDNQDSSNDKGKDENE